MPNETNRQNETILELSQLVGGLAHEIRNPLSTLRVNMQLLAEDLNDLPDTSEPVRRSRNRVQTMQNEVTRLGKVLNDFMNFVAHHTLSIKDQDINIMVEKLIDFYEPQAAAGKVRIMKHIHNEPLICPVDADLLQQALLNLFINAQQAMPDGGDLMVRTQQTGGRARIDVSDTGEGIDKTTQARIFDAFYSSKHGGSGLGLATAKRIVHEHGGTLAVESEKGKGTNFSIALEMSKHQEH